MKKILMVELDARKTAMRVKKVIPGGTEIDAPETPFIVVRIGDTLPTPSKDRRGGSHGVEIWVHDRPGSYERIDEILKSVGAFFTNDLPIYGERGSIISQAVWVNDSPELSDGGYHTICRMSSYKVIGVDRQLEA